MTITWARVGDEWGVRWENCPYPDGTAEGFAVNVSRKSGKKARVELGERVRAFRVRGGRWVDIYRVRRVLADG